MKVKILVMVLLSLFLFVGCKDHKYTVTNIELIEANTSQYREDRIERTPYYVYEWCWDWGYGVTYLANGATGWGYRYGYGYNKQTKYNERAYTVLVTETVESHYKITFTYGNEGIYIRYSKDILEVGVQLSGEFYKLYKNNNTFITKVDDGCRQ